jgi:molecular chaperone GrpE (heat shock protein)
MATDYWKESLSIAAEECELVLTDEQLGYLARAMEGSHDNYGLAFYQPPSSDRLNSVNREWQRRYDALQRELEEYRDRAEKAVKRVAKLPSDAKISIDKFGYVERWC